MMFDRGFTFEEHLERVLAQAKTQMAVLGKVSSCSWGLETGMIRLTGKSLVLSLLRYGLNIVGSGLSEKSRRIDARIINVLARKITGVGPSARLPVLHALAGVETAHNMFTPQCAKMLNLSLRADKSSIQQKVKCWLSGAYGVSSWTPAMMILEAPNGATPQIGRLRYLDCHVAEHWCFQVLKEPPYLPEALKTRSTYHSNAQEVQNRPNFRALTYDYVGAKSWLEIGVQIADASGWRPDCSASFNDIGCPTMPPDMTGMPKLYVRPYGFMGTFLDLNNPRMEQGGGDYDASEGTHIVVGAFFQNGLGVSAA